MFFSVKSSIKIAGKVYTPCVCYEANDALVPTISKLIAEGKAYEYKNKVFFQNGKVLEKMKAGAPAMDFVEKKAKKVKKENTVPVTDTEETIEENIPSPEEIADNAEDF